MRHTTILSIAFVSLVFGHGTAFAQPAPGEVEKIENPEPASARSRTADRLATPEARRNEKPLDWDVTRGQVSPEAQASGGLRTTPAGPPDAAPGGLPDPAADAQAESLYEEEWQGLRSSESAPPDAPDPQGINFGTQDVFAQYCENCPSTNLSYPQVAVGKLFTNTGTCSASVVSGKSVIVTAAHCCYNRGSGDWIRGWSFAPAYRDGFAPYGMFDWSTAAILTSWVSAGDRQSDVCVIKLRPDSSGKEVTYYTGWLGRSWNYGTTQVHHSLGYPGNIGNGDKLELCVSESFNPSSSCGGASVLNTGCSMTYGASGGPWVRHYRNGSWVNSVVSGYDSGTCTGSFGSTFNGPRFTSANITEICDAVGC